MKPPLYVRKLTEEERQEIEKGLKAKEGFKVRRSQMLKLSSEGKRVREIAEVMLCSGQAVRQAIRAFHTRGIKSLEQQSNRPKSAKKEISENDLEKLKELISESPRKYGKQESLWSLALLAEVSYEKGITKRLMSDESIRLAIKRLKINWKRAKEWITSPDEGYERKKKRRDKLIHLAKDKKHWAVGYIDEVWWSRVKIPKIKNWVVEKRFKVEKKTIPKKDKESKAIACYGCMRIDNKKIYLRFTKQRPKSVSTIGFLNWLSKKFEMEGKKVLVLFWDNATWHCSEMVRKWIKAFNSKAKRKGSIRLIVHFLPVRSPWLNPIEPCWLHGKKAVFEPSRILSVKELRQRICTYYQFPLLPFLST